MNRFQIIVNEKNEVVIEENQIYAYETITKTTCYFDDTKENRNLLNLPTEVNILEDTTGDNSSQETTASKWTHESISLLINQYESNTSLFQSPKGSNKSVWGSIANTMNSKGYKYTTDDCDTKFRNLKKTYRRIKDNNKSSGAGRIVSPYFDLFDHLFGTCVDINPIATCSNMEGLVCTPTQGSSNSSREGSPTPNKKKRNSDEPIWVATLRKDAAKRRPI